MSLPNNKVFTNFRIILLGIAVVGMSCGDNGNADKANSAIPTVAPFVPGPMPSRSKPELTKKQRIDDFVAWPLDVDYFEDLKAWEANFGKPVKKDCEQKPNIHVEAVDSWCSVKYEGLTLESFQGGRYRDENGEHEGKRFVYAGRLASEKWPVKHGLGIGASSEKVKDFFGESGSFRYRPDDGTLRDIAVSFEENSSLVVTFEDGKVTSIRWSSEVD